MANLSAAVVYSDVAVHLKDFAVRHDVPNIVRVTKGQYRNIGVAKTVHGDVYLHSIRTCPKVLAVGVKVKDAKKSGKKALATTDQKYALPVTYQGWWELLSEDGKAIRPLSSVSDLARAFPAKALVREPIKALVPVEGSNDLDVDSTRMLNSGEQLTLAGDLTIPVSSGKATVPRRLFRFFDADGCHLYLSLDQKGLFSPIAGSGNISGVHSIQGLLDRFRLPVLVRLVHGIIPMRLERHTFTGVFRLLGLYSDDTAFVMPLKRDAKMVPISTREPLKLVAASNFADLGETDEGQYYEARCSRMVASYLNSIHFLVSPPDLAALQAQADTEAETEPVKDAYRKKPRSEEDILFEEVDDIYQYVRDGGPAPPPRPRAAHKVAVAAHNIAVAAHNVAVAMGGTRSPAVVQTKPLGPVIQEYSDLFPSKKIKAKPVPAESLSSPKSPKVKSVDGEKRYSGEDYWDEPIYDEIDKFQKKIQADNPLLTESNEMLLNSEPCSPSDTSSPTSPICSDKLKIRKSPSIPSDEGAPPDYPSAVLQDQDSKVQLPSMHTKTDIHVNASPDNLNRSQQGRASPISVSPTAALDEVLARFTQDSVRAPPVLGPVRNLRQIYHPRDSDSSCSSHQENVNEQMKEAGVDKAPKCPVDIVVEESAPPLPPKRFVELEKPGETSDFTSGRSLLGGAEVKKKSKDRFSSKKHKNSSKVTSSVIAILNETEAAGGDILSKEGKGLKVKSQDSSKLQKKRGLFRSKSKESDIPVYNDTRPDVLPKPGGIIISNGEIKRDQKKINDAIMQASDASDGEVVYGIPLRNKSTTSIELSPNGVASVIPARKSSSPSMKVNISRLDIPVTTPPHLSASSRRPISSSKVDSHPHTPRRNSHAMKGTSVNVMHHADAITLEPSVAVPTPTSSVMVHSGSSAENNNALHIVYGRTTSADDAVALPVSPGMHTQRISITCSQPITSPPTPQHVAIARVGDTSPPAGHVDKANGRFAGLRKHIQSMYL